MKKLFLICSCALLLAILGPIPAASASWWPWGHHHHSKKASNPAPASNQATPAPEVPSSTTKKSHWPKFKHEKHQQQPTGDHLYSIPGTVGWWHHKGPGPAGAGS